MPSSLERGEVARIYYSPSVYHYLDYPRSHPRTPRTSKPSLHGQNALQAKDTLGENPMKEYLAWNHRKQHTSTRRVSEAAFQQLQWCFGVRDSEAVRSRVRYDGPTGFFSIIRTPNRLE